MDIYISFGGTLKFSKNTLIAREKLTHYLLVQGKRNDKSKWLAQAGYTLENWQILEKDLRAQILPIEARLLEKTIYGQMYEIIGELVGPNRKTLPVRTIWMEENTTGDTKFITMYPKGEEEK